VKGNLQRKQAYIVVNKQTMEKNIEYHKHKEETARPK
jgi:hypothetical protein